LKTGIVNVFTDRNGCYAHNGQVAKLPFAQERDLAVIYNMPAKAVA